MSENKKIDPDLTEEDILFDASLDLMNHIWNVPGYDIKTKRILINRMFPDTFSDNLVKVSENALPPIGIKYR